MLEVPRNLVNDDAIAISKSTSTDDKGNVLKSTLLRTVVFAVGRCRRCRFHRDDELTKLVLSRRQIRLFQKHLSRTLDPFDAACSVRPAT